MKLMKLGVALVGVALAVGMSACGKTPATSTTGAPAPNTTSAAVPATSTTSAGVPASSATGGAGAMIGISMPTTTLERWNNDGAHLKDLLEKAGYKTDLQFADNKTDVQISQIQNMINENAKVLVIAAIDGTTLGQVLATAAAAGIKVIAYDRLINGTDNVDYYATFDNYGVGKLQGTYIEETLKLKGGAKGPFNLETFAGSPDDNNAKMFFAGAYDILKPYIDSGVFVCPSGKCPASNDKWTDIGIQGWDTTKAQAEMENRLNSFYSGGKKVDVVLSPNDSLALGIEQALDGAGYKVGTDWPIVTGQDGDKANVQNIIDGKQAMTVWKDTRTLGDQVAKMVDQILKGTTVEVNDTKTYDNGKKVVPSYLLTPQVVTKDTVNLLFDSGFYKKTDFKGV